MTRVLVLGTTGMLGSMVSDYLRRNTLLETADSARDGGPGSLPVDAEKDVVLQIERILTEFIPDYVVNCVGVINTFCRDDDPPGVLRAVRVNAFFPHSLAEAFRVLSPGTRTIHITTDCVFSGRRGHYDESAVHDPVDFYGKSKSLGEVQADGWLNVRCSIIGPERTPRTHPSLLEWFLRHPPGSVVPGFTHHQWNGVTTLQFAQFCEELILHEGFDRLRREHHTIHYVPNEAVSKYVLLQVLNETYQRDYAVVEVDHPPPAINRTLASQYLRLEPAPMGVALRELRDYAEKVFDHP